MLQVSFDESAGSQSARSNLSQLIYSLVTTLRTEMTVKMMHMERVAGAKLVGLVKFDTTPTGGAAAGYKQ